MGKIWLTFKNKPESEFSPRTRAKSTYFDFNTLKSNLF